MRWRCRRSSRCWAARSGCASSTAACTSASTSARRRGESCRACCRFRSERGRNYARVFAELASEVGRLRREQGRDIALTFITHAECHIPTATVEALARDAYLYGIFILPSKPIDLEYLTKLNRFQVVTAESLSRAAEKRRRALEIVEDVASG